MLRVIFEGNIDSDFNGFDENTIFKMNDGTYWIQDQYCYWYYYAYRPEATITEENGSYILTVEGQSIPVKRLYGVIESNIDGVFNGWNGTTAYKLTNGQIWQQAEYKYEYNYSYRPEVIICDINGSYIMCVEGSQVSVKRI